MHQKTNCPSPYPVAAGAGAAGTHIRLPRLLWCICHCGMHATLSLSAKFTRALRALCTIHRH